MQTVQLTKDTQKSILNDLLKRSPNNYGQYESAVEEIIHNVREKGDEAVFAYTKQSTRHLRLRTGSLLGYSKEPQPT